MPRTIVFIDGFNLYYSRLRGSPFKWLDIVALFRDQIVRVQDPDTEVVGVHYFTAPIKASYASHGVDLAMTSFTGRSGRSASFSV